MQYKYWHCLPFRNLLAIAFLIALVVSSCQTVKPYQRAYLNDDNMQTGKQTIEKFSGNAHTYREAASGGAKGKTSGGCGCN